MAACYRSCLELADKYQLESIAFCCISTGVFNFPPADAAAIAVKTVQEYLKKSSSLRRVIFNVFKDRDYLIYQDLLK